MKHYQRSMSMPEMDGLKLSVVDGHSSSLDPCGSQSCRKLKGFAMHGVGKDSQCKKGKPESPVEYILEAYKEKGLVVALKNTLDAAYFLDPTEQMIASYDHEVVRAARNGNLEKLRSMHQSGRSLQCCNRFGESIIHLTCRRGYLDVLEFLVTEANVSLNVRDDFGRTPMHDACWTSEPNFAVMERLIMEAPEHLILRDARGHTPFDYARREHWGAWLSFLEERRDTLFRSESN